MNIIQNKHSKLRERVKAIAQIQNNIPTNEIARLQQRFDPIIISSDDEENNENADEQIEREINKITLKQKRKKQLKKKSQSIRKVQQCEDKTLQNKQCRKRTAHTNKCWIHLAKNENLRIKPSGIKDAGKGLYAYKKPFKRGDHITPYTGRVVSSDAIANKYGEGLAEYALCYKGRCTDANWTTDRAARYANDAHKSKFRNNADLVRRYSKKHNFGLEANKYIKPGEEIFTNYGNEYWKHK